ncbi:UvrD-helicase domain-containing protein (plasmid) [Sinorhizobium garamanticum]|uniref:DNA 3'-5' helicase II n=1 Tax=Sinorhizobium garamanticum TaxID=680247 RepID=A0ABY8DMC8_9HYPH|nr:UvrD-helicase domain-containing protein [Sinorhizobium garamanticum]WEX91477.1 UvrD-helicase domain-containing protein [Sinorhizobium garamanticum]
MITVAELTPEILAALSEEMGGCDFSQPSQRAFLSSVASCDVQAAPGNGKTTLLVAKLSLLSRTWNSRSEGVCIISHTNAARIEVEKRLASHASASAFLSYPHFIGTVTTFIDRFIALPYLRGLGWPLRRIDDAVFAAIAKSKVASRPNLRALARRQPKNVENWVANLEFSPAFNFQPGPVPDRIGIRVLPRQVGPHTDSGAELEQIKASITRDGYYRFGDMTALAAHAVEHCPGLVDKLRARFPLVILDEAQDTHGPQLALLRRIFDGGGVAFQLLGDQNQTLYEDPTLAPGDYWQPAVEAIPLNETRRFGEPIAAFASRLTVRRPQIITGVENSPGQRHLIMFNEARIGDVIPTYAAKVREHWGNQILDGHETWAVSSRHNLYRDRRGSWPKSLVDYHPAYRPGSSGSSKPASFCAILRQAATLHAAYETPARIAELFCQSLSELLSIAEYQGSHGNRVNSTNVWRILAADGDKHIATRHLLYTHILNGQAVWSVQAWQEFLGALSAVLGVALDVNGDDECAAFVAFIDQGADNAVAAGGQISRNAVTVNGVRVQLGSIHSVKGRTVDAILVLETEIYRGQAADQRAMDLTTVLPHALGIENRDFAANDAHLTAATNVFVGITRPRTLLALGVRKESVSPAMMEAAVEQGWILQDLTV